MLAVSNSSPEVSVNAVSNQPDSSAPDGEPDIAGTASAAEVDCIPDDPAVLGSAPDEVHDFSIHMEEFDKNPDVPSAASAEIDPAEVDCIPDDPESSDDESEHQLCPDCDEPLLLV